MRQDGIIGHYRIVRSLGQGGMGEVYAAHDEKLKRKVAIKSIRAGDRLDESTKQRFLREARILSSLDHPYICKIFDYIETEDNDYLVLEFIEGETLTRAVADGVDASARLPMAEQIAQVLVTAHGEGIVHRDLKPMNIMVTPSGDIRVLDFGLAHSGQHRSSLTSTTTDHDAPEIPDHQDPDRTITYHERDDIAPDAEAFQTLVGRITGTPYYMSPEQARGEVVSAASDMYSFGLLLQFLFTGHAPYDEDLDTQAVLDRAKHCRTQAVTGVNHDLKDLIEALKSPAAIDRPTAAQTLQRLHWIMEKPRRRVRRAVIAILMLISLLAGLKYTLDLRHEQRLAVAAQQDAEHRRTQAEDLISFMLGDLRTRLEDLDRLDVLDAVGEQAMSYFASLPEQQLHDEELARVVQNLQQIGEVRIAQGQLAGASVSLNEARRLSRNLVDRDPSNQQWLFRLSQVHFYIGNVAWMQHDLDAMLESFLAYRDVVERLVDLNPDKLEWTLEEAYAQTNLGVVYQEQGRLDLAVPAIRESIRIKRMLTEMDPAKLQYQESLANGLSWLATLQKQSGDLRGALQTFQDELQMRYALCERDRLNMRARYLLAISHSQVGLFHRFLGHGARAREHFGRMNELASELAVHDPDNSDWRRELAFSQHLLGELQYLEATSDEATRTLAESERLFLALAEADATNRERQLDVVSLHCTCSEERYAAGEVEAALAFADRSIARLELISNDDQEDRDLGAAWTRVLIARGRALTALNRAEEAMKDWERGLAIFESLFVENPDLEFRSLRVMLLICLERDREAEMLLDVLIEGGFRDDLFVRFMADSDLPAAKAFASEPVSVRAESERELESDPNP